MSSPRHSIRKTGWGRGGRRAAGFTLGELMLVLLILGLAAVLAFTGWGRLQHQRDLARLGADLQEFSAAFQAYYEKNRAWPASTTGEVAVPPGMEDALAETNWGGGSPFGGSYGWDRRGAVVLTAFSPGFPLALTRTELLEIDRRLDDGNPATGSFRTGFNGWPVYLVGSKP